MILHVLVPTWAWFGYCYSNSPLVFQNGLKYLCFIKTEMIIWEYDVSDSECISEFTEEFQVWEAPWGKANRSETEDVDLHTHPRINRECLSFLGSVPTTSTAGPFSLGIHCQPISPILSFLFADPHPRSLVWLTVLQPKSFIQHLLRTN